MGFSQEKSAAWCQTDPVLFRTWLSYLQWGRGWERNSSELKSLPNSCPPRPSEHTLLGKRFLVDGLRDWASGSLSSPSTIKTWFSSLDLTSHMAFLHIHPPIRPEHRQRPGCTILGYRWSSLHPWHPLHFLSLWLTKYQALWQKVCMRTPSAVILVHQKHQGSSWHVIAAQ